MKHCIKTILFTSIALTSPTIVHAEQYQSGVINFNANPSPVEGVTRHQVTLYGCNTKIDTTVDWGRDNQVLAFIPYGQRQAKTEQSEKPYYVSKYYLVSPPLPVPKNSSEPTNIGLLTPDTFQFKGSKPVQIVNLDYNILQPTYLHFVPVEFDQQSCGQDQIKELPVNIQCPNFPWFNGGEGASGIAVIENDSNSSVFIPTLDVKGEQPLQCSVTLLDDIMLEHEIYIKNQKQNPKTINLTEFYLTHGINKSIQLACKPRPSEQLPIGCQKPQ